MSNLLVDLSVVNFISNFGKNRKLYNLRITEIEENVEVMNSDLYECGNEINIILTLKNIIGLYSLDKKQKKNRK